MICFRFFFFKIKWLFIACLAFGIGNLMHAQDLVVGGDYDYPPHSYITADSSTTGYDIAVLEEIKKHTDLSFSYKLSPWDSALVYLKKGDVDILTGIIYSEEREAQYDFTVPIHTEYYAIFTREEFDISELEDLTGRRAALLKGDISVEKLIKPLGLLKNAEYVNSLPEAITSVEYKKADYVIAPYSLGKRTMEDHHLENVVVKGPRLLPSLYCLAVKKGNISLLVRLNHGISELKQSGELEKIEDEWFRFSRKREKLKKTLRWVGIIGGLVLLLLVLLYAWFRSLKQQVKIKTRQILQTERKYRNLFNFNKDGLILFDLHGVIVDANPEACKMYGYKHEEMMGMDGKHLVAKSYRHLFDEFLSCTTRGNEFIAESYELRKDGSTFPSSVKALKIDNDHRLFVVVRDMSEKKKAEEELIDASKKAEKAYEYKSNFLSHVSHEVRTPLNAIIGYSRLLNNSDLDERQKSYSKKLMSAAEFLVSFISDTLDLSKLETGKVELERIPFSLDANLQYVNNILSVLARQKGLDWKITVESHVHNEVFGDPMRLRQILLNLGNNAIKYTREGKIALYVTQVDSYAHREKQVGVYRFEISDTGSGIPEEQAGIIFEPFNQAGNSTARRFGGTGLGLSICRDLVNLMGGSIELTSKPGKGSTFSFTIPLTILDKAIETEGKNDCHTIPEASSESGQGDNWNLRVYKNALHQAKVLVADDSDFNVDIMVDLLHVVSCQVQIARDGRQALHQVQQEHFDAVLMDVQMPEMDGNETTRRIRKTPGLETLPIIGLSARSIREDKRISFLSGMDEYLVKPVVPEKLYDSLARVIQASPDQKTGEFPKTLLNTSAVLLHYNEDWTIYQRALTNFMFHFKNAPADLTAMHQAGNMTDMRVLIHNLVNAFGTIGAFTLESRGRKIENVIRENNTLDREALADFISSFESLIREIEDRNLN